MSGKLLVARSGSVVTVMVDALVFDEDASFVSFGGVMPAGFRPVYSNTDIAMGRRLSGDTGGALRIDRSGRVYLYQVKSGLVMRGSGAYLTEEAFPNGGI